MCQCAKYAAITNLHKTDMPTEHQPGGESVVATALDSRLNRSRVRLPAMPVSGNNRGQVVHTHAPLSPSSILRYRSRGGDALRLGR